MMISNEFVFNVFCFRHSSVWLMRFTIFMVRKMVPLNHVHTCNMHAILSLSLNYIAVEQNKNYRA